MVGFKTFPTLTLMFELWGGICLPCEKENYYLIIWERPQNNLKEIMQTYSRAFKLQSYIGCDTVKIENNKKIKTNHRKKQDA